MATLKNDLSLHNLTLEEAIELALDKPLWRLLAASGAMHWWCMPNNDDDVPQQLSYSPQAALKMEKLIVCNVLLVNKRLWKRYSKPAWYIIHTND